MTELSNQDEKFYSWAADYFLNNEDKLNVDLVRKELFTEFMFASGGPGVITPNRFVLLLRLFCEANGIEFNPMQLRSRDGRILRKVFDRRYDPQTKEWITSSSTLRIAEVFHLKRKTTNHA